jgi:cohesin loading factor subunit SCC2
VRKRVVKLLRSLYDVTTEHDKRVDICIRLVQRVADEDDGVKELAVKSIEELWFHSASLLNPSKSRVLSLDGDIGNRRDISSKIAVIMAVCAAFKDRQTSLDDVMYKIMSDREAGSDSPLLLGRYREMCEALIEGLVDDSDIPGFVSAALGQHMGNR